MGLDGGLLLCYLKVVNTLGYLLFGLKRAALVVDEGSHLVLGLIGLGEKEGDKVDHVSPNNGNAGWSLEKMSLEDEVEKKWY